MLILLLVKTNSTGQIINRSILGFNWLIEPKDSIYQFRGVQDNYELSNEVNFSNAEIYFLHQLGVEGKLSYSTVNDFTKMELFQDNKMLSATIKFSSNDLLINHYLKLNKFLMTKIKGYENTSYTGKSINGNTDSAGTFWEKYSNNSTDRIFLYIKFDRLPQSDELTADWLNNHMGKLVIIRHADLIE